MTREEIEGRIGQIGAALDSLKAAWPHLSRELAGRVDELCEQLITAENEQVRGRIKALREVLDLPQTLHQEREGLNAGLSEQSDPDL